MNRLMMHPCWRWEWPACGPARSGAAKTSGGGGGYVDDIGITRRVKAKLAEDPSVGALRIDVETLHGTVRLAGFADDAEKARAARIARGVSGVKDVRDHIVLRAPGG